MNQVWLPLECNEPDLRLWSLNVIALLHSENEKMMEFGDLMPIKDFSDAFTYAFV